MDASEIRNGLLEILQEMAANSPENPVDDYAVLLKINTKLGIDQHSDIKLQQLVLTIWHDFFRNGYLSWGHRLYQNNMGGPAFHFTERGRNFLGQLSRDPANPEGYMAYLKKQALLNPIAQSYIEEALKTYNNECYKATAVMTGCAAESISLELRDILVNRLNDLGRPIPRNLTDWRIKTVLDEIKNLLTPHKRSMGNELGEAFEYNWPAFTNLIRTVRNDAGHPISVDPVTPENVHATLLLFPNHAKLAAALISWINSHNF
jgi:hypothetical protein